MCMLQGCKAHIDKLNVPSLTVSQIEKESSYVTDYLVLGPFPQLQDPSAEKIDVRDKNLPSLGLDIDYLTALGSREDSLDETFLQRLEQNPKRQLGHDLKIVQTTVASEPILDLRKALSSTSDSLLGGLTEGREKTTDLSTAYAFFNLLSDQDRTIAALVQVDDEAKVWCNQHPIKLAGKIALLPLRKGRNFIAIKVYNRRNDWTLAVDLMGLQAFKNEIIDNEVYSPWKSVILPASNASIDASDLAKAVFATSGRLRAKVEDADQKTPILDRQLDSAGSTGRFLCPVGLHRVSLIADQVVIHRQVYCSDSEEAFKSWYEHEIARRKPMHHSGWCDLDVIGKRMDILTLPQNYHPQDLRWQQKMIVMIEDLSSTMSAIRMYGSDRDMQGMHFRGYLSSTNGDEQAYGVYVPPTYRRDEGPSKLVVVVPYVTSPNRPFLESVHAASMDQNQYIKPAKEHHTILLILNGRSGESVGHPIGERDIFDSIASLQRLYSIDRDRISLIGVCSGGLEALTLAVHHPDEFASVALLNPLYFRGSYGSEQADQGQSDLFDYAMNFWRDSNSPAHYCENVRTLPVFISHARFHHAPFAGSVDFVNDCKLKGVNPVFREEAPGTSSPEEQAFQFFDGKRRDDSPRHITIRNVDSRYSDSYWLKVDSVMDELKPHEYDAVVNADGAVEIMTENVAVMTLDTKRLPKSNRKPLRIIWNGTTPHKRFVGDGKVLLSRDLHAWNGGQRSAMQGFGTLQDTFGDCELFVEETGGNEADRSSAHRAIKQLSIEWARSYFSQLASKLDYDVSPFDMNDCSLIGVGKPNPATPVGRLFQRLPVRIGRTDVHILQAHYDGSDLGAAIIYPSPVNSGRYLAEFLTNDPSGIQLPLERPWVQGAFGYIVWQQRMGVPPEIEDVGYITSHWKHATSITNLNVTYQPVNVDPEP